MPATTSSYTTPKPVEMDCIYVGTRDGDSAPLVTCEYGDGTVELLDPRLDLANHSPTGFEWGYGGSGPTQLALAIVAHVAGDGHDMRNYLVSEFKVRFVQRIPRDAPSWVLSAKTVWEWVQAEVALSDARDQVLEEIMASCDTAPAG